MTPDAEPLVGPSPEVRGLWHAAGLRSLGPVWSRPTIFGHGVPFRFPSTGDTGPGLTDLGRALVRSGTPSHRTRRTPPRMSRTTGGRMPARTGPPETAGRWALLPRRDGERDCRTATRPERTFEHEQHGFGAENPYSEETFEHLTSETAAPRRPGRRAPRA